MLGHVLGAGDMAMNKTDQIIHVFVELTFQGWGETVSKINKETTTTKS